MTKREKLRKLIFDPAILVLPGAYDALSAKIIEQAGFDAVYMTGFGQSASYLGQPDVGLMTMSDMVNRVNCIAAAVDVPVLCDGDTGFGNELNVIRTMREYEHAGAAAIQLEDQTMPKKCGHMEGKKLVPMEEMVSKVKAAARAREDKNFLIVARTDARAVYGIEDAIKRANAYVEAGADVIFVEAPASREEMKMITSQVKAPTLANMVEKGGTPVMTAKELEELGYSLVIFPVSTLCAAANAVKDCLESLKATGCSTEYLKDKKIQWPEFNAMIGLPIVRAIESGDLTKLF